MIEYYRRPLPHWQPKDAVFFVTIRLKNSLPKEVVDELRAASAAMSEDATETGGGRGQYLGAGERFVRWDDDLDRAEFGPR